MCDLYKIIDPRPNAKSAPYTFHLPEEERINAISIGDTVKAMIQSIPPSEKWEAERMWVEVTSVENDWLEGTLDSHPDDMPKICHGDIIRLPRSHVLDIIFNDYEKEKQLNLSEKREYWERCLVEQDVIDGKLKVDYLYREEPDMTEEGDKFPDSGWRIRGDMRETSDEELDKREVAYVALGVVLNKDDSWLHLIDEPVGAKFIRDFEKNIFEPTE